MIKKDVNIDIVANRIRNIRKSLGLSMEEFASRIDERAKSGTVSNWETGKNLPNNKRLNKIAELGDMSLDQLLYGSLEDYIIKRINYYIEDIASISLDEESKSTVRQDALKQSLMNPIIHAEYEDSKIKELNSSINYEARKAEERLYNHTDFTNAGFINYVSLDINLLKRRTFKYLNNGIDKNLYNEVITILDESANEIRKLKDKYSDKN